MSKQSFNLFFLFTTKLAVATLLLVVGVKQSHAVVVDGGDDHFCLRNFGTFTATTADKCPPDAILCTNGILSGHLETYDFVMWTLEPDPDNPNIMVYTGQSTIQTQEGHLLFGEDSGAMYVFPNGTSALFITTVNIVDGDGPLEDAFGRIVAIGILDFITGESEGIYGGKVCVPH